MIRFFFNYNTEDIQSGMTLAPHKTWACKCHITVAQSTSAKSIWCK